MKKSEPSAELRGTTEFKTYYTSLSKDSELHKKIANALDKLRIDICVGDKVEKKKWPKTYIKRYGIRNLFKLDAGGESRLTYTIIADGKKKVVCVIEFFPDHKSYSRRFGYKK